MDSSSFARVRMMPSRMKNQAAQYAAILGQSGFGGLGSRMPAGAQPAGDYGAAQKAALWNVEQQRLAGNAALLHGGSGSRYSGAPISHHVPLGPPTRPGGPTTFPGGSYGGGSESLPGHGGGGSLSYGSGSGVPQYPPGHGGNGSHQYGDTNQLHGGQGWQMFGDTPHEAAGALKLILLQHAQMGGSQADLHSMLSHYVSQRAQGNGPRAF